MQYKLSTKLELFFFDSKKNQKSYWGILKKPECFKVDFIYVYSSFNINLLYFYTTFVIYKKATYKTHKHVDIAIDDNLSTILLLNVFFQNLANLFSFSTLTFSSVCIGTGKLVGVFEFVDMFIFP